MRTVPARVVERENDDALTAGAGLAREGFEQFQLPAVFATIKDTKVGAILVSQTLYFVDLKVVATLALEHRVASIGSQREFAEAGALMAYGANIADLHRRVASYVDKILKGAKPANLPVEQPTRFEFVINARTAKALGLAIPLILLTFADEVIE